METNSNKIKSFLQRWRYATTELLKDGAFGDGNISDAVFKTTMYRMRKQKSLFTSKFGHSYLHFDSSFKKRWQYLESLASSDREAFVRSSGIEHHLCMLRVASRLQKAHPTLKLWANVLSEAYTSTLGVVDGKNQKHAPDLTVVTESDGKKSLCYVEVERSLKAEDRYRAKWRAYEGDPKVQSCLYWVYDDRIAMSLSELMRSFFSRRLGFEGFFMGVALEKEFQERGPNTEVKFFSLKGGGSMKLARLLSFEDQRRAG